MSMTRALPSGSAEVPFAFLRDLYTALHGCRGNVDKSNLVLRQWIGTLRSRYPNATAGTWRAILRMTSPGDDVKRRYGLKETRLGPLIARFLGLEHSRSTSSRGYFLHNWFPAYQSDLGDTLLKGRNQDLSSCMGDEVYKILLDTASPTLYYPSLLRVDGLLDELATHCVWSNSGATDHSSQARRSQAEIVKDLLHGLDPASARLLVQIILQETSPILGWRGQSHSIDLVDVVRAAWPRCLPVWSIHPDLDVLAACIESLDSLTPSDPDFDIQAQQIIERYCQIQLGTFTKFAKSHKHSIAQIAHSLAQRQDTQDNVLALIEKKYDGERIQVHFDRSWPKEPYKSIRAWSKSGRESTRERWTLLERILQSLCQEGIESCILDGEMCSIDETTGQVDEFWKIRNIKEKPGSTRSWSMKRSTSSAEDSQTHHLCMICFDILELNGKSLVYTPQIERRKLLEAHVRPVERWLFFSECKKLKIASLSGTLPDPVERELAFSKALRSHFAQSIAERSEGLVIKIADDPYQWPTYHQSPSWFKLKKDYVPGLGDAGDFAVIGIGFNEDYATRGRPGSSSPHGIFAGQLNEWYIATLADERSASGKPIFDVCMKTGFGLSREQWQQLEFRVKYSGLPFREERHAFARLMKGLPFSIRFHTPCQMRSMIYILTEPLIFEVFGGSFDKACGSSLYHLRWPRISKVYDPESNDRSLKDIVKTSTLQEAANTWLLGPDQSLNNASRHHADGIEVEASLWEQRLATISSCSKLIRPHPMPAFRSWRADTAAVGDVLRMSICKTSHQSRTESFNTNMPLLRRLPLSTRPMTQQILREEPSSVLQAFLLLDPAKSMSNIISRHCTHRLRHKDCRLLRPGVTDLNSRTISGLMELRRCHDGLDKENVAQIQAQDPVLIFVHRLQTRYVRNLIRALQGMNLDNMPVVQVLHYNALFIYLDAPCQRLSIRHHLIWSSRNPF